MPAHIADASLVVSDVPDRPRLRSWSVGRLGLRAKFNLVLLPVVTLALAAIVWLSRA